MYSVKICEIATMGGGYIMTAISKHLYNKAFWRKSIRNDETTIIQDALEETQFENKTKNSTDPFTRKMYSILLDLAMDLKNDNYTNQLISCSTADGFESRKRDLAKATQALKKAVKTAKNVKDCESELRTFLSCLNSVYEHKKTLPSFRDKLFYIADFIITGLAAVGLTALLVKCAGPTVFGGAFAHHLAAAPTATKAAEASVGMALYGLYGAFNHFRSYETQIKASIDSSIRARAAKL